MSLSVLSLRIFTTGRPYLNGSFGRFLNDISQPDFSMIWQWPRASFNHNTQVHLFMVYFDCRQVTLCQLNDFAIKIFSDHPFHLQYVWLVLNGDCTSKCLRDYVVMKDDSHSIFSTRPRAFAWAPSFGSYSVEAYGSIHCDRVWHWGQKGDDRDSCIRSIRQIENMLLWPREKNAH